MVVDKNGRMKAKRGISLEFVKLQLYSEAIN
jgi:hypothetical protein